MAGSPAAFYGIWMDDLINRNSKTSKMRNSKKALEIYDFLSGIWNKLSDWLIKTWGMSFKSEVMTSLVLKYAIKVIFSVYFI